MKKIVVTKISHTGKPLVPDGGGKLPARSCGQGCSGGNAAECCGGGNDADCGQCSRKGACGEIEKGAKAGGPEGKRGQKSAVIAFLDDDKLLARSLERLIRGGKGEDIRATETVEEMVELIETGIVDLAILDLRLAEGQRMGTEVIKKLGEKGKGGMAANIVMYTSAPHEICDKMREFLGEDRIFTKPNENGELQALVRFVVDGGSVADWKKPAV
jgi:CheY-like chemotaxis protein